MSRYPGARRLRVGVVAMVLAIAGITPGVLPAVGARPAGAVVPAPDPRTGKLLYTKLVDTGTDVRSEIWVAERDGSGQRKVANGRFPSFSPDGLSIVFTSSESEMTGSLDPSNQYVYSVPVNGGTPVPLSAPFVLPDPCEWNSPSCISYADMAGRWAGDMSSLIYLRNKGTTFDNGDPGICDAGIASLAGDSPTVIIPTAVGPCTRPDGSPNDIPPCPRVSFIGEWQVSLMPSSTDGAFAYAAGCGDGLLDVRIHDGGSDRLLAAGSDIRSNWTADGSKIVLETPDGYFYVDRSGNRTPVNPSDPGSLRNYTATVPRLGCTVIASPGLSVFSPDGQLEGFDTLVPESGGGPAPACPFGSNISGIWLGQNGGTTAVLAIEGADVELHDIQCTPGNCLTGIKIVKEVPDGAPGDPDGATFNYTGSVNGSIFYDTSPFASPGSAATLMRKLPVGQHSVTESTMPDYQLTAITCDDPTANVNLAARTVSVNLTDDSGIVTCTFRSRYLATPDDNRPPVAVDDVTDARHPGSSAAGIPLHPLANDSDPDGDPLSVSNVGVPSHGTATFLGGVVNYHPDQGYVGTDSFSYTVSDGRGGTDFGTITVRVRRPPCILGSGLDVCGDIDVGDILVYHKPNFVESFFGGTWWSHAAIVVGKTDANGDGVPEIQFADAFPGRNVQINDLATSSWNERIPFGVIRPSLPEAVRHAAANFASVSVGAPYTIKPWAGLGDAKYYCSGLVWRSYKEQGYDLAPKIKVSGFLFAGGAFITPDDVASNHLTSPVDRRFVQRISGTGSIEVAGDGVELVASDEQGRRVGEDAAGNAWDEIAGAEYQRNVFGPGVIADGLDGGWSIELTAEKATDYHLTVTLPSGASGAQGEKSGHLLAGETAVVQVSDLATHPPRAAISVARGATGSPPLTVRLDASASTDPDDAITSYGWDYDGDGTVDEVTAGPVVQHTYPSGTTIVTPAVFVEDASGGKGSASAPPLRVDFGTADFAPSPTITPRTTNGATSAPVHLAVGGFATGEVQSWTWLVDDTPARTTSEPALDVTFDQPGAHTVSVAPTTAPELATDASVAIHGTGPPQAVDDEVTVEAGRARAIAVADNDSDPGGALDLSTVALTTEPAHGSAVVSTATGRVRYSPADGYTGPDTFDYEICDAQGACATATARVTVAAPSGPTAVDDSYTATGGSTLSVGAPGVLANDTDPTPGDVLEAGIARATEHGTIELSPDGSFRYTPVAGFVGSDTFDYVTFDASDQHSHWAAVTINVQPAPALPRIGVGDASVAEGNAGRRSMRFTVSLSTPARRAVTVRYTTRARSATAGTDFVARSGTATIPAGSMSIVVSIAVKGDDTVERHETFTVQLSSAHGAAITRGTGTGTILNDDPSSGLRVSVGKASVVEGNVGRRSLALSVTLSKAAATPVSVRYATHSGTARAGTDFVAKSGTATIRAGATSTAISIPVLGDTTVEPSERFSVTLANPRGAKLGLATATATIINDD